ncbi:MAG: hypothetical protein KAY12_04290, partial [Arenimonas sp.]|nr:hypothetical protein [Arenimonas sp.]
MEVVVFMIEPNRIVAMNYVSAGHNAGRRDYRSQVDSVVNYQAYSRLPADRDTGRFTVPAGTALVWV